MPNPYTLIAAGVVVLALVSGAGWLGYDYADSRCAAEREEMARQASEALAALATRFQNAEQRYEAERDRKQRVVERVKTEVRYEIRELPSRDCGLLPDARRLLVRSHCAAFGDEADPECVPDAMRTSTHPSESRD